MNQEKIFSFKNFILTVASAVGVEQMDPALAGALGPDIEYRLREIIQEAIKFMKHSKREKMLCSDVSHALSLHNVEQLFGYSGGLPKPNRYVRAQGVNTLFFPNDEVVDFNVLLQEPPPPVPRDVTFSVHWLAIEGVQPAIPQNPSQKKKAQGISRKKKANPSVKPVVQHVLSVELQRYFEELCKAVLSGDQETFGLALSSVASDPALNDLLPYMVQFVGEQVTKNLRDLKLLMRVMQFAEALLRSEHFHVEPYLHQLVPAILTCIVGRQLCSDAANDDHWALRDFSANMIADLCQQYGSAYASLQPRICKTLVAALLDASKPLTTHYGAIRAISALGSASREQLLFPNLATLVPFYQASRDDGNALRRMEAGRVLNALLDESVEHVKYALSGPDGSNVLSVPVAAKGKRGRDEDVPPPDALISAINPTVKLLKDVFGSSFEQHAKEKDLDLSSFK